jgi:pyridoxal phosphate enzyme (YggS family)
MSENIRERFERLRAEIDAELASCGRRSGSVRILGVSKKQPADAIVEAVAAGVTDIGENYVQEAKAKFAAIATPRAAGGVRTHFIGHVQTNKAKALVSLFDVVQSVDRADAAEALGRAAQAAGRVLPVLIQLNISPAERFGCPPEEAAHLAEAIGRNPALRLDGVMAIGPISADRAEIERAFAVAAKTFALVGGSTLSIGMSGDWREAVRAGSTMVRIGTALFGERTLGAPQA